MSEAERFSIMTNLAARTNFGAPGACSARTQIHELAEQALGAPSNRMNDLRLISFLPAATEMACALGLERELVGVSHECDFPMTVRNKPVVVRCALPVETMTLAEIDVAVANRVRNGQSLYEVDQGVV